MLQPAQLATDRTRIVSDPTCELTNMHSARWRFEEMSKNRLPYHRCAEERGPCWLFEPFGSNRYGWFRCGIPNEDGNLGPGGFPGLYLAPFGVQTVDLIIGGLRQSGPPARPKYARHRIKCRLDQVVDIPERAARRLSRRRKC